MEKHTGINIGKICSLELIETREVDEMYIDRELLTIKIDLVPQKQFVPIVVTDGSADLQVKANDGDDGSKPHYQIVLTAKVPKVQADRIAVLHGIKSTQFIARATDALGNRFIIGNEASPAVLLINYGIASASSGSNEAEISITSFNDVGLFQQVD